MTNHDVVTLSIGGLFLMINALGATLSVRRLRLRGQINAANDIALISLRGIRFAVFSTSEFMDRFWHSSVGRLVWIGMNIMSLIVLVAIFMEYNLDLAQKIVLPAAIYVIAQHFISDIHHAMDARGKNEQNIRGKE
ncbi:MAG: hypothetical protein ACLPN5_15520 [Roseiarcus sp.]